MIYCSQQSRRKRGGSASSTTPPTPIATPTSITAVVAAPRLSVAAKGKQPARATSPTDPSDVERTEAEQLKIVLRRSRQETHISQHGGFSTDEGTGHIHDIRYLTDVNLNKLYQPWRSFASVINKCLTGKSSGVDSFILSQAQMLWGFYHRINIDFAYLIWDDFVIHWHYVRDDTLFSTIKVVSRHQATQQYGAILPIELTTAEIRNSKAYQEYHACAMGDPAPKPKASARKKKGDSASSTTPSILTPTTTAESAPRLSASAKGKQPFRATTPVEPTDLQRTEAEQLKIVLKRSRQETHISQQSGSGTGEGTGSKSGVPDVPSDDLEEELSCKSSDDEEVGSHEEGKESDDDSDEGSDNDSDETV
nr:hypothetical protein [Tanacetum cinerariifolium]